MDNLFRELIHKSQMVIDSGDDAGCSSDLIVIGSKEYNELADMLTKIRQQKKFKEFNPNPNS